MDLLVFSPCENSHTGVSRKYPVFELGKQIKITERMYFMEIIAKWTLFTDKLNLPWQLLADLADCLLQNAGLGIRIQRIRIILPDPDP